MTFAEALILPELCRLKLATMSWLDTTVQKSEKSVIAAGLPVSDVTL